MTTKADILKAIRRKCTDCSGGQIAEVKLCPVQRCELWPFRLGMDPNPSKPRGVANRASRGAILDGKGMLL
jgi:hypothetical protein